MPADVSDLLALADDFDQAGNKMARKTVEAVTEAAEVAEKVAKAWAPERSGDLKRSITTTVSGGGGAAGARATVRANIRYGWYVEAGTARMAPQPYMEPGRAAAEPVLEAALERAVDEVLG